MINVLPTEGSTTLDHVASAIRAASTVLAVEDTAELRAVLVPVTGGQMTCFAGVLRVGWPSQLTDEPIVYDAGGIKLVAVRFQASHVLSKQDLVDLLNSWRPFVHQEVSLDFQDSVNINRNRSRSDWTEPTWVIDLPEKTSINQYRQGRSGPFLHAESGFFAEDVGDAARQWLGVPRLDQNSRVGVYEVAIRDRRAWFKKLAIDFDAGVLAVEVERHTKSQVYLTVIHTELGGRRTVTSQELTRTSISVPLPLPLTKIRISLGDSTGTEYDGYSETAEYIRPGAKSLLYPPPVVDPEYQELRHALDAGESETVEFKEWLPVNRARRKSYELLKAATAFANGGGGVIYVGVTDDCEVVGTAQQLGTDDQRNEYARVLRRLLSEGISPAPANNVNWVTHAGKSVLRIQVSSKGAMHCVAEDGAIYVRRAASDRKATPAEIEAMVLRSQQPTQ